jgi:GNAT superfamily N-acetyltransferase
VSDVTISVVRSEADIADTTMLVWEFFDFLRLRYPDMIPELDAYIESQEVAARLADFTNHYNPPAGECFLARRNAEPVGIVMVRPRSDGAAELNRMYVRETARGTGTGRALCARAIGMARDLGYPAIWLSLLHRHVEAMPLYTSFGFQKVSDPDEPQAGDERVTTMRLDLVAAHET